MAFRSLVLLSMAGLIAASAAPAHGQTPSPTSSLELFGVLDLGVELVNHVGANSARLVRMPSLTGTVSSRLGVRVREDLGGGLAALAVLEMGLAPDTGTQLQGGRGWGRQSFVGLSTPWRSFSLGRQYTMLFWSLLDADILGPNIYGTGSLDAGLPNARSDNTLGWRGNFGGWTLGATTSFGRDVVNAGPSPAGSNCPGESGLDARACRGWSLLAKFDTPRGGLALADDRQHGRALSSLPGGAVDAVFGGLDSSAKVDRRVSFNGYLRLGTTKFGAGLVRRSNEGDALKPDSRLWYVGVAQPLNPLLSLDAAWVALRYPHLGGYDASLLAVRATYSLSRRTALHGQWGHIRHGAASALSVSAGAAGSNPAAGRAQAALHVGVRHSF